MSASPSSADPQQLAAALCAQGRFADAAAAYEHIVAQDPQSIQALVGLSFACTMLGRLPEALDACRRAVALNPAVPELHNNLGSLFNCLAQHGQAEAALRQAIALRADYAEAHFSLGTTLVALDRLEEAEAAFHRVVALCPGQAQAHWQLASVLARRGLLPQAEAAYRQALALQPDDTECLTRLGATLHHQGRLPEAMEVYRQALALQPEMETVRYNLGLVLGQLGHQQEAEALLRQAIGMRPDHADAKFGLAMVMLGAGKLEEGWPLYEFRHEAKGRQWQAANAGLGQGCPTWRGEPLAGKSLLVWHEQGFGDMLQFGRYLAAFQAQGAARITLACFAELRALYDGLPGVDTVDISAADALGPAHDFQTFLMSAPRWLGTTLETIPQAVHLKADARRMPAWRERLAALPGRKIGLVWRGNPRNLNDHCRSLPTPAVLAPLWRVPGLSFVGLQKGPGEDAIPLAGQPLLHLGPEIRDFADSAAIVEQLDLVISVDTAIAHLAGSLGKPCWVLLPAVNTDWRWLRERDDSPWYPGTMRLFRQSVPGDWGAVVAALVQALQGSWHS